MEKPPIPQASWSKEHKDSGSCCPFEAGASQVASLPAAAHLRHCADRILSTWTQMVRRQATHAQGNLESSSLRNSLPELLDNLAQALENPRWRYGETRNSDIARKHGQERQNSDVYSVAAMIDEYAILRHVICENMQHEQRWPAEIIARIHAFVDAAICVATQEFVTLDTRGKTQKLMQQRDELDGKAAEAKAALKSTQKQRDDAHDERDASRSDVAGLLEEKQVRERFVALLTHDLRSPLSSIGMNVQRMERKLGDVALASRLVPRVLRAVHRLDHMIQDMLDASRLRAGQKMPIALAACDLVQVATETCEDLASTHGARIKLQAPAEACGTWDGRALRRVIENLVGNALKYGGKETDVTIAVFDQQDSVRLSVHNHGQPLNEQDIEVLFDPYARTMDAEASEQRGWGLGLTLVRGVTEAHGGKVGAASNAESGTTFWCEFPKALC